MAGAGVDAVLVSQPESRRYLSGYSGSDLPPRESAGYLLVTGDRQYLLTDPRTEGQAAAEAPSFELRVYGGTSRMSDVLRDLVTELGIARIGFEAHHLSYGSWRQLTEALEDKASLLPTPDIIDQLRSVKDPDEIDAIRNSVALNDAAFAFLARQLRPGVSELDLAWETERYFRTHGAEGVSFDPITVAGPNTAIPHARPGERLVESDDLVIFDMGAKLHGYCSDMTRTICIDSVPDPFSDIWQIVLGALSEAEQRVQIGMTGTELDAVARGVIEKSGYGDAFVHGLGHGIGLEVHEPPWVTRTRGDMVLQQGMVFSIEPGIYLPGTGGVRIEDLVLLTERGAEVLCSSPKKLRLAEVLSDLDR